MSKHQIALIPGDGIGQEVVAAARQMLESLSKSIPGLEFEFEESPIGVTALKSDGVALPARTLELARRSDAVIHGATDGAEIGATGGSPLSGLRRGLDAYANVRPAKTYPGVPGAVPGVDLIVVRENTEGLYSGIEYKVKPDVACAVRVISVEGTARVARKAFQLAQKRRKLLTVVHKLGSLPLADGLLIDTVRSVAQEFPDVTLETRNVDATVLEMVRHGQVFDVILAENQYSDILSDVAAALVGGLGLAASGSYGDKWALFEPVHGTAPDIAGQGVANPIATFLAARMMLEHLGEQAAADRLGQAILSVLAEGKVRTPDFGGKAKTADFTQAVIDKIAAGGR